MKKDNLINRVTSSYEGVMKNDIAKQALTSGRPRAMSMQSESFMYFSAFPDSGPVS